MPLCVWAHSDRPPKWHNHRAFGRMQVLARSELLAWLHATLFCASGLEGDLKQFKYFCRFKLHIAATKICLSSLSERSESTDLMTHRRQYLKCVACARRCFYPNFHSISWCDVAGHCSRLLSEFSYTIEFRPLQLLLIFSSLHNMKHSTRLQALMKRLKGSTAVGKTRRRKVDI